MLPQIQMLSEEPIRFGRNMNAPPQERLHSLDGLGRSCPINRGNIRVHHNPQPKYVNSRPWQFSYGLLRQIPHGREATALWLVLQHQSEAELPVVTGGVPDARDFHVWRVSRLSTNPIRD